MVTVFPSAKVNVAVPGGLELVASFLGSESDGNDGDHQGDEGCTSLLHCTLL